MLDAPQLQSQVTSFKLRVTHIGTDKDYDTISLKELLTCERTTVAKDQALLTLCSTYNKHDARSHKAQERNGRFVMLAIDMDAGNVPGSKLAAVVQEFTGQALMRVYASSSATKDNRKWRVIIPTLAEMTHDEWHAVTVALNRHIEKATGHRPDRALEGAAQGNYMPNTAPRTDGVKPLTDGTLIEAPLFNWRDSPGADSVLAVMQEEEDRRQEDLQRAAEARRRLAQVRARPDSDRTVIEQFNSARDLEQVLTACGYKQGPKGGWRSPNQSTDSFATKVFDEPAGQYWVSKSASDFAANIGNHARDGASCFGDAFDVWCFYMHANDRTAAIKAAADELGIQKPMTDIDRLAERLRANQLAKQRATVTAPAVPAGDVEFPEEPTPQVQQQAQEVIERAAESAAAQPAAQSADSDSVLRTLPYVQASNLPGWEPPRELIEGMLIEGGMTVIYGDSNTGKSFLTLDMAAHIALGRDWFGRKVKQGAVVYLAAESPRSIIDRSRALANKLDTSLDQLFITNCPIDLYDPNGDSMAVVNTIEAIEKEHGVEVCLIVADTLARIMGAGDENATRDMNVVVKNVDVIRAATRAQFVLIHHTGKDTARGARGSSALRAATDTEIEVSDPGNQKPKEFKVTKQRDLQGKGEVYGFILVTVNLGLGVFDNLMTTCYVQQADPEIAAPEDALTIIQREILDHIRDTPIGGIRFTELVRKIKETRPTTADSTVSNNLKKMEKLGAIYYQSGQYRAGNGRPTRGGEF